MCDTYICLFDFSYFFCICTTNHWSHTLHSCDVYFDFNMYRFLYIFLPTFVVVCIWYNKEVNGPNQITNHEQNVLVSTAQLNNTKRELRDDEISETKRHYRVHIHIKWMYATKIQIFANESNRFIVINKHGLFECAFSRREFYLCFV